MISRPHAIPLLSAIQVHSFLRSLLVLGLSVLVPFGRVDTFLPPPLLCAFVGPFYFHGQEAPAPAGRLFVFFFCYDLGLLGWALPPVVLPPPQILPLYFSVTWPVLVFCRPSDKSYYFTFSEFLTAWADSFFFRTFPPFLLSVGQPVHPLSRAAERSLYEFCVFLSVFFPPYLCFYDFPQVISG